MKKRAKKVEHMLDVLKHIHRIEELKKVELQRKLAELEQSQHEVIHALNTDDALHGLFVDTTAKFLSSLAKEAQHVAEAKDIQSQRILENASKLKHAERLSEHLERENRRIETETQLHETIERVARPGNTSPP
ncbi:MAG: hypothetical protein P8Y67_10465 [Alphaproteobacteria bacterium]